MNKTLFELSDEAIELDNLLDQLAEEEDQEGIAATIEGYLSTLDANIETKLDNYAGLIMECEARSDARKAEAQRLVHRAKVDANKAENLKRILAWAFQRHEWKTKECPRYRITLATNGGKLPLMLNPDLLTEDFLNEIVSYMPDTDRIREALEAGQDVPGAMLGERGSSIRIK